MNSKIERSKSTTSGGDMVKYIGAALLVLAGLFVWFWFSADVATASLGAWGGPLRVLAVIIGLLAGGFVFMLTGKGHWVRSFLSESRFELRKVVWPKRQEAIRMTWVVILVVVVLSLLLGGFDFVIQKLTQLFLGR